MPGESDNGHRYGDLYHQVGTLMIFTPGALKEALEKIAPVSEMQTVNQQRDDHLVAGYSVHEYAKSAKLKAGDVGL